MGIYLNKSVAETSISDMCKTIRRERNITQYIFADLVGTNQTEVSFIERGFIPSKERIVAIVDLYKQSEEYKNGI